MERRNFVSVVPAAKKSKLGPIFSVSKYPCHIQTVGKKAKNRTKNQQTPSKKGVFFPVPPTTWPSLAGYGLALSCPYPAGQSAKYLVPLPESIFKIKSFMTNIVEKKSPAVEFWDYLQKRAEMWLLF